MQNGFRQSTKTSVNSSQRVDPKVVLGSQVLQLSGLELEGLIKSELVENPALERIDDFEEPLSLEDILASVAPQELKPSGGDRELMRSLPQDTLELDWLDLTSSVDSLWNHLLAQLRVRLPEELWDLATYFVGSVNERGYLTCSPEEAALDCDSDLDDAYRVHKALRECEPPGVGAEDLRDCLCLQLRSPQTDAEKVAKAILKRHWDDVVQRNNRAISRALKVPAELVEEAFEVITSLDPFPGEDFSRHAGDHHREAVAPALPDVIITLLESGFLVEIPGPSPISLRVNPTYSKRQKELSESRRSDAAEKRHINEFVERANRFLDALNQRRRQLAKIGRYLIEHQSGFVKTGEYKFLKPLTRSQVAKDLGVHESTISRATAGKFIQIANGDVVSFEVFFKPALRIQKMIEEILQTENPGSPLSDERISQMLADRGVHVARRTVNKYRDKRKLLSSRLRRTG
ncbi:RNA polymerase factor sigma-54 [Kamptonema cortianum]|nr:RNA polymerase factor sigma-54 [Geitlerinema splendidum]MDK3161204.1 RNA polymerase factor sigma-54 [Kamptonema cortianum]